MQTKSLIQSAANILKITNIKKGDVLKMIETAYSGTQTFYGVVIDLLNTGDKCFIQILRYEKSYGEIKAEIKTFEGDKDIAIFPAEISEVKEYLQDALKRMASKIEDQKKALHELIEATNKAEEFVSGALSQKLTVASFEEISQAQFDAARPKELEK